MQNRQKEYQFSTFVNESVDRNEFVIEFFPSDPSNDSPKVTRNFDELIDFFEQLPV
ncbi:hypothetical protein RCG24_05550 [Neobacillus sp. OS1-32]|uniref:hypothetical protein n=1 Tax=Neobacillus sp. OS1-32 TaxID=3070682 RepID=UPI0027DF1B6A|nr:hypothetical protein [Neobacillus sp. OS1-32]WML31340.1 hypothetical protein RCG24_05550 [Neobacillus sp. OS1-32]